MIYSSSVAWKRKTHNESDILQKLTFKAKVSVELSFGSPHFGLKRIFLVSLETFLPNAENQCQFTSPDLLQRQRQDVLLRAQSRLSYQPSWLNRILSNCYASCILCNLFYCNWNLWLVFQAMPVAFELTINLFMAQQSRGLFQIICHLQKKMSKILRDFLFFSSLNVNDTCILS